MPAFCSLAIPLAFAVAAAEAPLTTEAIESLTREVSRAVEQIRGLVFERPVAVKVVSREDARAHFTRRAAKLWPEEDVRLQQTVYAQLGLVPAGTDLLASLLDVLEEQAMGYYDPGSDTFYVVEGGIPAETAPTLLAHELTHALDDQHYDLDRLLARAGTDEDRGAAVAAVVEGSGTAVMTAFVAREIRAGRLRPEALQRLQEAEAGRTERLRSSPPLLQRSLLASYALGLSFLLRGDVRRLAGGLDARDVNHAFEDPPASSEQILHPEKYWDETRRDPPRVVSLPDLSSAVGPGFALAGRGTLGEIVLAVLTGAGPLDPASPDLVAPSRWTNAPATGTAGDAYHHYTSGERRVTMLATDWDSEPDAQEFQAALQPHLRRRSFRYATGVVVLAGDDLGDRAEIVAAEALRALAAGRP